MSSRSFHLEKSLSATTATTKHCTVLNTHCVTVTSILFGYSSSNADCMTIHRAHVTLARTMSNVPLIHVTLLGVVPPAVTAKARWWLTGLSAGPA